MILSVQDGVLAFSELSYLFEPLSYLYVGLKFNEGSAKPLKARLDLISLVS